MCMLDVYVGCVNCILCMTVTTYTQYTRYRQYYYVSSHWICLLEYVVFLSVSNQFPIVSGLVLIMCCVVSVVLLVL